jgi:hypothetical protein
VPLDGRDYDELGEELRARLLDVLGGGNKPGEPLVQH